MTDPVIGHDRARRLLEAHLPPVTLLRGAESIGKWTLASHIVHHHRVALVDRFVVEGGLTTSAIRDLIRWANFPPSGPMKVALINLAGATHPAYNLLFKILEQPPADIRFILVASFALPDAFVSRCATYTLTPLTVAELRQVLVRHGMSKPVADRMATSGRGQVGPALARASDTVTEPVLGLVKALATRDRDLFEWAVEQTTPASRDLLHRWLVEALTGDRTLFTDEEMFGLHTNRPLLTTILQRLSVSPDASARLQVRAALEPLLDR